MLVAAFTVVLSFCLPRNIGAGMFIMFLLLARMLITVVVYLYIGVACVVFFFNFFKRLCVFHRFCFTLTRMSHGSRREPHL